jgi:hypothetical protein
MLRKKPDERRRSTSEGEPRRRGKKIMQSTDSSRARTFSAFEEAKERRMKKKNASDMNELLRFGRELLELLGSVVLVCVSLWWFGFALGLHVAALCRAKGFLEADSFVVMMKSISESSRTLRRGTVWMECHGGEQCRELPAGRSLRNFTASWNCLEPEN